MNDQELVEIFSDISDLANLKNFLRHDLSEQNEILFKFKKILKLKDSKDVGELNKIIKLLPYFGFFKNIFSEYLWCTPKYAEKMGFESPEDLIGKSDLYFPWSFEMATAYQEADELVLLGAESTHRKEQWLFDESQGSNVIVAMNRYPVFDRAGHVIGVFGVGQADEVSMQLAKISEISKASHKASGSVFMH
jgi:hypothetical protein